MKECPQNLKAILQAMRLEELHWVLGRYCGPHNYILAEKKFGTQINRAWVEDEIMERHLFDSEDKLTT